ncbi:uncharacterized protein [Nicotiana tomentosiformis]|uniref:uncharacterized protein n=1 Tax=Nicotiana tomentosiformis TaxID=4098 RepID=UPI00388C72D9
MWDDSRPMVLAKGMLFPDKVRLSKAAKMYNVKECREMTVLESSPDVYMVVCRKWFTGCYWMLRASKKNTGLWKVGIYIPTHICEMDTFNGNHYNLDIDSISLVLIPHLEASIKYKIKSALHQSTMNMVIPLPKERHFSGANVRLKLFMVTGTSHLQLYPSTWPHCNTLTLGRLLNGSLSVVRVNHNIFNYVFWAFKPAIDGFPHCRPVISIDDTHVYGKYDIKLLIVIAVDANGQIFPLAFAICSNESQETWTLFLNHLKEHVVKQRSGICLISDRHCGILSSVENLPAWKEPYAYYRYCVRHFKANFQKAHPNKDLHDLMWMAATDHQEHKFRRHMESIRQEDERTYHWLMRHELHK